MKSSPTGRKRHRVLLIDPTRECLKVFNKYGISYTRLGDEEKQKLGFPKRRRVYVVEIPDDIIEQVRQEYMECVTRNSGRRYVR